MKSLPVLLLAALLASSPAFAGEKKKTAAKKEKAETGPSCKVPSVGRCATCSITCRPGETVTCSGGVVAGDVCHTQPSCKCGK
jgi:hypothetical protein